MRDPRNGPNSWTGYSSSLGHFYCREVYANLCLRVKLHMDWLEGGKVGDENSKDDLDKFIFELASAEEFDAVDKTDFVELHLETSRTL
jgi:hypothetical protein